MRVGNGGSSRGLAWWSVRIVWALLFVPMIAGAREKVKLSTPTASERLDYLRRGRVWEPTDVATKDLYKGPSGEMKFGVDQEVSCDFVPKPLSGWTAKFLCRLDGGRIVKVKYEEGDKYKEVYGEVLGARLFWALGFYANDMFPVRVTCHDCPQHPWAYVDKRKSKRHLDEKGLIRELPPEAGVGTYTFDPASIEEKLDAQTIEIRANQGWSWKSLGHVDEKLGGATKAEIDAFELLNAFVQNADNKAKQNALVCPRDELVAEATGEVSCGRPVLYVDDLGSVFGKGGFTTGNAGRVDYDGWRKHSVWRDRATCTARLASVGGIFRRSTLSDPVIGEAGRALLSKQLEQLSDAQIADLFRAARIEKLHQTMPDGVSGRREVTIDDWVELFKTKRGEITGHPGCPTPRSDKDAGDIR